MGKLLKLFYILLFFSKNIVSMQKPINNYNKNNNFNYQNFYSYILGSDTKSIDYIIKKTIMSGIDPNIKNQENETLLMIVCKKNWMESAKFILSLPNININARDKHGYTAIMYSIINQNLELVKLFLTFDYIEISKRNDKGYSPLMYAYETGNENIIKHLLEHPNLRYQ